LFFANVCALAGHSLPAMCLQSGGLGPAPLKPVVQRLHELLRAMHHLRQTDSSAFRESYAASASEAVKLAQAGCFDGYVPERRSREPSALHYAAGCGCLEACSALLERCGRLNFVVDLSGQTPLFWAAQSGFRSTAAVLLRHGADALHADGEGRTPLHVAAARGCLRTCELLLDAPGVREGGLQLRSGRGQLPLHAAAAAGHAEVCFLLLRCGAEVAAVTPQGRTALHLAALEGHTATVEGLLTVCPAMQKALDIEGMRALDYAEERGWASAAAVLSSEDSLHRELRARWRSYFEPPCRALLNTAACDAFLEIGRPHVLGAEHTHLRLSCRVVDTIGLVQGYTVEIRAAGGGSADVRFARSTGQRVIDDVELVVPKHRIPEAASELGLELSFRVVGLVDAKLAATADVGSRHVYSSWTSPASIRSWVF